MTETETVEGTTGGSDDDSVSVEGMTDLEIQTLLEDSPVSAPPVTDPDPKQDDKQKTEAAPPAEKPKDDPKFVDPAALPKVPTPEEYEDLKKQLASQREFLARRSNELGTLRKEKKSLIAQLRAKATEIEDEDPRRAAALDRAAEDQERITQQLEQEEAETVRIQQNLEVVPRYVKPDEWDVEAMCFEMKEDGVAPNIIETFRANPYASAAGTELIHLGKRAFYGKHLRQLVPITKGLYDRVKELEAQLSTKGADTLRGVKRAMKSPPQLTAASSATEAPNRQPSVDPSTMSDAELEALINRT